MNQLNTEKRVMIGSLSIDPALEALVREEIIPGLGLDAEDFWNSFSQESKSCMVAEFSGSPRLMSLLGTARSAIWRLTL